MDVAFLISWHRTIVEKCKQYPIAASCSLLTITSGAVLAKFVIANIDKTLRTQNDIMSIADDDDKDDDYIEAPDSVDLSSSASASIDKVKLRIPRYNGPNPFTIQSLSLYEKCKIYFFCMTGICHVRLASVLGIVGGMYLLSLPPCNRICTSLIRGLLRCALFTFGFYYIPIAYDDQDDYARNAYRVIAANHNTVFDGLVLLTMSNGCVAAKNELSRIPIIGRILKNGLQFLWIDRSGTNGRNNAKQQILNHVQNESLAPLIIFPQGTCSNVRTLTCFKVGAFLSKKPVLPLALNWNGNRHCDLSYVSTQSALAMLIHCGCCQFINYCRVCVCKTHAPNRDEQKNVNTFAENVRREIASQLAKGSDAVSGSSFQMTPHSLSDFMLFQKAAATKSKSYAAHMLMGDAVSLLQLRASTVSYLAARFKQLDLNGDGYIDYLEFCQAFGADPVQAEKQMKNLFYLFDTDQSSDRDLYERITFDEFLVGVALCFMDTMLEDAVRVMYNGCADDDGLLHKRNILDVYQKMVDPSKFDDKRVFNEWLHKMKQFETIVFRGTEESLNLQQFYDRIASNNLQHMVQHFCQSIITMKLKIKLSKKDFSTSTNDETTSEIFINPATQFVRSSSILPVESS